MRSNFIYKNPLTEYHAASVLAFKSALASWLRASRGRRSGVPQESLASISQNHRLHPRPPQHHRGRAMPTCVLTIEVKEK
jgi:hypothetical protein